jgi:carbonic anhydrase
MTSLFNDANGDSKRSASTTAVEPASACASAAFPHAKVSNETSSRQTFFKTTIGGAVAGLVTATGVDCLAPRRVSAQSALSPDAALQELMDGNRRFATGSLTSCDHDLAILKAHTVDKQEPFAAVLSCADSRVPVELIFDQTLGQIFVTRVAGNFAAPEIIASLEYGAAALGTKVIVVLAHSGCGAVKATIQAKDVPGQISSLFAYIRPAVDQARSNIEAASKANAKIQAGLLRQASTVISAMVKDNKVKVVAAYYDLATGTVSLLD